MFSCEIFENSKNTHFEEHLRTTVLESYKSIVCIRKTLVLGKPVNDTINLQILFIENMNLTKLVCAIFTYTKMPFVISFRPQKRTKWIMITILKHLEPPVVVKQFYIVLNKLELVSFFRTLSTFLTFT